MGEKAVVARRWYLGSMGLNVYDQLFMAVHL